MILTVIILTIAFIILGVLFLTLVQSLQYGYEFQEFGISLFWRSVFGRIEINFLKFNLIRKVRVVSPWKVFPLIFTPFLSYGYRWWQKRIIMIQMKPGLIPYIILTPIDLDQFINKIQSELPQGSYVEYDESARGTTNA
jgi:hypothetical protein